jgi:uncharacterized membrane protein YphA (DoxX/SURF4 family)
MQLDYQPASSYPVSKKMLWTGRVISALPVLLLLFSGVGKLLKPPAVIEGFQHLGFDPKVAIPLGILEIACTILYIIPRTAVLGAILLTGYLGGAINTHLRIGEQFIGPAVFGVLVWIGLYLRDPRLPALIPLRRPLQNSAA